VLAAPKLGEGGTQTVPRPRQVQLGISLAAPLAENAASELHPDRGQRRASPFWSAAARRRFDFHPVGRLIFDSEFEAGLAMSNREAIGFALAFIGGFGGLAGALVWRNIVSALNLDRPANDQIPLMFIGWDVFKKWYPFPWWSLLKEFRRKFSDSPLYARFLGCLVWMWLFILAGAALNFSATH
jgi:hypothetical protein